MAIFNMIGGGSSSIEGLEFELWDSGTFTSSTASNQTVEIKHKSQTSTNDFANNQPHWLVISRTSGATGNLYLKKAGIFFTRYSSDEVTYYLGSWRWFETMNGSSYNIADAPLSISISSTGTGSNKRYTTTFTVGPFQLDRYGSRLASFYGTYDWAIYKVS